MSSANASKAAIYFSYSQFMVFDHDVRLPGLLWTEEHVRQGFARRERNVSFGTLLEFGNADVILHNLAFIDSDEYERVIEVPIELSSGKVLVGGPEMYPDEPVFELTKGHYRLTAAQSATGEKNESIALFFELLRAPLAFSRIVRADRKMKPPAVLLETAETA